MADRTFVRSIPKHKVTDRSLLIGTAQFCSVFEWEDAIRRRFLCQTVRTVCLLPRIRRFIEFGQAASSREATSPAKIKVWSKKLKEVRMKRLLGLLISGSLVVASASPIVLAQQPDKKSQGVTGAAKDAGKGAKEAAGTTGSAAAKTTKKGAKTTKKGVNQAAKGTKKGAEKAGEKTNPKY